MRPHERLDVWNKAIDLVMSVYKATDSFPREERFGLTSQIRRAAVSIPADIAEGAARDSQKEFAYFLSNAQGSASELETEILIARRLGYLAEERHAPIRQELDTIGRMIVGLSKNIKKKLT
jgi:four helix bundle protein